MTYQHCSLSFVHGTTINTKVSTNFVKLIHIFYRIRIGKCVIKDDEGKVGVVGVFDLLCAVRGLLLSACITVLYVWHISMEDCTGMHSQKHTPFIFNMGTCQWDFSLIAALATRIPFSSLKWTGSVDPQDFITPFYVCYSNLSV